MEQEPRHRSEPQPVDRRAVSTPAGRKARATGPKRIMYVDHTAKLGGGEIALLLLVQHLDRERFEPVVVLGADGPLRAKLEASGIETHLLAVSASVLETRKDSLGFRSLLRIKDAGQTLHTVAVLARLIRRHRVALVHTNSLKADLFGGLAARVARVPLIWHVHDRIVADYLPKPVVWAFRRLCRWMPQYVIANSNATLETLELPATKRAGTIYCGIEIPDHAAIDPLGTELGQAGPGAAEIGAAEPSAVGSEAVELLREGLEEENPKMSDSRSNGGSIERQSQAGNRTKSPGVAPDAFRAKISFSKINAAEIAPLKSGAAKIGLIGRISPWKGQHIFLQAAAKVLQQVPSAQFEIIGAALFDEEAYEKEVRALAAELRIRENVSFLGFREDVPRLIEALDVVVHASTTAEPFGQVIIEAMAASKPVVATDGGGPREIVVPGETGLLVPMGDPEKMAEAIVFLIGHPAAARDMGIQGHKRVREHFTIQQTARMVETIYDRLLTQ